MSSANIQGNTPADAILARTNDGYHFVDSKWLRMFMDSSMIKDEFFDLIVRSSVEN